MGVCGGLQGRKDPAATALPDQAAEVEWGSWLCIGPLNDKRKGGLYT